MAEKTGIQMIEELLAGMSVLDRRIQVLEQLLKQLLASANTGACALPPGLEINGKPVPGAAPAPPAPPKPSLEGVVEEPIIRAAPNARVVGRILKDGKPVPEVNVTIHDDRNNAVRKTRTNRSGEWMAQLPPGKYAAECFLEGRVNGNVVFTVAQGDRMVRVGQPQ